MSLRVVIERDPMAISSTTNVNRIPAAKPNGGCVQFTSALIMGRSSKRREKQLSKLPAAQPKGGCVKFTSGEKDKGFKTVRKES